MTSLAPHPLTSDMSASYHAGGSTRGEGREKPSRIRAHKGNMPSLPQTKYCSLCPAKFTRTTHLNRHLRSHTNERLHRCEACHSQFTRSDLLTRHKRSCGDPLHVNRSRRKSCQACADSKIKCDLQYPCSKCSSRGRQCIFINDPKISRKKKAAAAERNARDLPLETFGSDGDTPQAPGNPFSDQPPGPQLSSTFSHSAFTRESTVASSPCESISDNSDIPMQDSLEDFFSSSELLSSVTSSSESSMIPSPHSATRELPLDNSQAFDPGLETFSLNGHASDIFPADVSSSNSLFDEFCAPCNEQNIPLTVAPGDFMWMDSAELQTGCILNPPSIPAHTSGVQSATPSINPSQTQNMASSPCDSALPSSELQHYLYLFFTAFLPQIPLIHPSTWEMSSTSPLLLRAMQACGALFVKTHTAVNFVSETLHFSRDILIQESERNAADWNGQIQLLLAMVLLQTIGLFHQRSDQRVTSNKYHSLLIMMIRRCQLVEVNGSWMPQDLAEPSSFDAAWRRWAQHETIKRALIMSYLYDCCRSIYFGLPASCHPSEFDLGLPCENALWEAKNANEWYNALQKPSPYGNIPMRLMGVSMRQALSSLEEMRLPSASMPLNPFAHFVLIHSILRNIYSSRDERRSEDLLLLVPAGQRPEAGGQESNFTTQYVLHNWLQSWLSSPESCRLDKEPEEPPFVHSPLPYYWLAQVSLLASGENNSPLDSRFEVRFRLVGGWIRHIRGFIRARQQIPSHLWDELMKFSAQNSVVNAGVDGIDNPDGLLSFFS